MRRTATSAGSQGRCLVVEHRSPITDLSTSAKLQIDLLVSTASLSSELGQSESRDGARPCAMRSSWTWRRLSSTEA